MVQIKLLVLASFLFLASVQGEAMDINKTQKKKDKESNIEKAVNELLLKNNTTVAPSSSTDAPSTPAPTTSTAAPTTSTAAPTTSTAAPTTPTPAPPAPPTPAPPADKGKWAYWGADNKTCVIVQMALKFNISYDVSGGKMSRAIFNLPVNKTTVVGGSCNNDTQFIQLQWPTANALLNNMTLTFDKNSTSKEFSLEKLDFQIVQDAMNFPGTANENKTLTLSHSGDTFSTSLGMSYRCVKMQDILMESAKSNSTVAINDVQFQAFHTEKGTTFGSANDCDNVDVPDIVPIAVGCALGALVLIVLIAYLVGRRRSHAQGYLSM